MLLTIIIITTALIVGTVALYEFVSARIKNKKDKDSLKFDSIARSIRDLREALEFKDKQITTLNKSIAHLQQNVIEQKKVAENAMSLSRQATLLTIDLSQKLSKTKKTKKK